MATILHSPKSHMHLMSTFPGHNSTVGVSSIICRVIPIPQCCGLSCVALIPTHMLKSNSPHLTLYLETRPGRLNYACSVVLKQHLRVEPKWSFLLSSLLQCSLLQCWDYRHVSLHQACLPYKIRTDTKRDDRKAHKDKIYTATKVMPEEKLYTKRYGIKFPLEIEKVWIFRPYNCKEWTF